MLRLISALFVVVTLAAPASAAKCGGDFNTFIAGMARDAQAAGVSRAVIDQAFAASPATRTCSPSTGASAACSIQRVSRNTRARA